MEISKIFGAKEIFITIKSDSEIILNFIYYTHGMQSDFSSAQLLNNITTRVELFNGVLTQKTNANGNSLLIKFPLL